MLSQPWIVTPKTPAAYSNPSDDRVKEQSVRIGIVGAGGVVERAHLPVLRQFPGVSLSWLCDLVSERAQGLARAYRLRNADIFDRIERCGDVDTVLIAIPVGK